MSDKYFTYTKKTDTVRLKHDLWRMVCQTVPIEGSMQEYVLAYEDLKELLEEEDKFKEFLKFIASNENQIMEDFNRRAATDNYTFYDLPILFKKGTEVIIENDNFGAYGAKVISAKTIYSFLVLH